MNLEYPLCVPNLDTRIFGDQSRLATAEGHELQGASKGRGTAVESVLASKKRMIHLGLTAYGAVILYATFIATFLLSVFWRPIIGLYFLVLLLPLQTARYYVNELPLGKSLIFVSMFGVLLGLVLHGYKLLPKHPWNALLGFYTIYTFISLCQGSFYLGSQLPLTLDDPRLADWVNYMTMPLLLILMAATVKDTRQMKIFVLLMCAATLVLNRGFWDTISGRDFSAFSYDLRDAGGMGYAGVNGFAAFEAQFATFLLALASFRGKLAVRVGYVALAVFSVVCLMYSLSRGGYLALLVGCLFLGFVKQRKLLLVLLVLPLFWASLLPRAVQQRVTMTYDARDGELDHSAELRVDLWHEAMHIFDANPAVGAGFYTYFYGQHMDNYTDTHNYFIKVLIETGVLGLGIFLWLLVKAFRSGYSLFRRARDPFLSSLGLGLAAWVICSFVANLFGDRWSYLQVNGYMWVLAGLVVRGMLMEQETSVLGTVKDGVGSDAQTEALNPQLAGLL